MYITFYGAAREVTGSMHLLTTDSDRILFDCGLHQGRRKECDQKNRQLPFDPQILTNMVLSHAHIDHSGRIPMLTKSNFQGRIICTRPTADACRYLLLDSAHIQESDAHYLNYKSVRSFLYSLKKDPGNKPVSKRQMKEIKKLLKKNNHRIDAETIDRYQKQYHLDSIEPLYSIKDAEEALEYFDGYPFKHPVTIGANSTCTFYVAGHILGSALTIMKAKENGLTRNVCFSGDIGRFDKPIIKDPTLDFNEEDRSIDLLVMESTYGDRVHDPVADLRGRLSKVIMETHARGGSIIIPVFAFGRTQDIVYVLHELYDKGEVPKMPVYVDSPLAVNMTKVFGEHPETYDEDTHKTFLEKGENPFSFSKMTYVQSVEESMALMRDTTPHIVISASGMCESGRILHHLRYAVHNPKNTILLVGYMAQNTLGRKIEELGEETQKSKPGPEPLVKIFDKLYPLRAQVVKLGGFSGHGDKNELLKIIKESNLSIKRIALVHGEETQSLPFAEKLRQEGYEVVVPHPGESVEIL